MADNNTPQFDEGFFLDETVVQGPPPQAFPSRRTLNHPVEDNDVAAHMPPVKDVTPWYAAWQTWLLVVFVAAAAVLGTFFITDAVTGDEARHEVDTAVSTDVGGQIAALETQVNDLQEQLASESEKSADLQAKLNEAGSEGFADSQAVADLQSQVDGLTASLSETQAALESAQADAAAKSASAQTWEQVAHELATILDNAGVEHEPLPNSDTEG